MCGTCCRIAKLSILDNLLVTMSEADSFKQFAGNVPGLFHIEFKFVMKAFVLVR